MAKNPHMMLPIAGVDEAGRGPLAGPVTVAAVILFDKQGYGHIHGIKDSKRLSPAQREVWFLRAHKLKAQGILDFAVSSSSEDIIDTKGIVFGIKKALHRVLKRVCQDAAHTMILLDGSLAAPSSYLYQETIIRGDEKEPLIALASVIAKVTRDRYMVRCAKKFPQYGFDIHKGYGTQRHYAALKKHGISPLHRKSFLTGIESASPERLA
ncbi:MAG: ribonuclease HII [Patescibacteria group bacterium]